jgi:choline dehydrogenase-like flavoprotein
LYEVTQVNGQRCSSARAYLRPARSRPNLTVLTGAHATRVLFEGRRAKGVAYRRDGAHRSVAARREVILSGGAINSPQLLLLSGVGPSAELQALGIPVVHDLPGVGKNLQDHLDVTAVQACTRAVSYGLTPATALRGLADVVRYVVAKRGMYTTNAAEAGGFVKSTPQEELPDLQFHFTTAPLSNHGLDVKFLLQQGYSLHVCDLRPLSRGEIRLAGRDPFAHPLIEPNYLADPRDLEKLVLGVKAARRILAAPAFDPYRGEEIRPGPAVRDDEEIREFIRRRAETIYHPVGTCKMGNDPLAVVDPQLRVRGVQGLRVADASIMPLLVGGNTNAPAIMIGEKSADLVRSADY